MYKFKIIEDNTYYFITNKGVEYNIRFKYSPYVLGQEAIFSSYVFELIIEVVGSNGPGEGADELIPFTVHSIFSDFYKRNNENNICLYICESSDGRQEARARKFIIWFKALDDKGFIQISDEIKDSNGIVYPVAVLMRNTNPFSAQIIAAFNNLITTYSKNE